MKVKNSIHIHATLSVSVRTLMADSVEVARKEKNLNNTPEAIIHNFKFACVFFTPFFA
jgi:hypothetical protein